MTTYFEYQPHTVGTFDPTAIVAACIENGHQSFLLNSSVLPREFFDLSSGLTGSLVQRISLYGIRMAVVVPDPSVHSKPFRDFVLEANKGSQFRFVPTKEEAVDWLSKSL